MAGLVVAVRRDGSPIPDAVIDALADAVAHRGPDGVTTTVDDGVVVIHAALNATPEAALERQPLRHPSGTSYVADARVDNRSELLAALGWVDRAATVTDLDLLAEVDQRWGRAGLERVVGDFAFVAIDRNGRVRAVRDHLGIKPLYLWCSDRWIVLASELRQIVAHPDAPRALDPSLIGQYLSGRVEDAAGTVLRGVRRVPAAHVAEIGPRDREPTVTRYWLLPYDQPLELADDDAYRERCAELLTEAVRCRLRTAGPVGVEITGGLDSTSVAALASRLAPEATGVDAWSCEFPDTPGSGEDGHIELAVAALGLDWEPVVSDPGRGRWVDDDVAFSADIPLPPDGPDHLELCRRAADRGCRVVLTGHGGDHWFETSHLVVAELLHRRRPDLALRAADDLVGGGVRSTLGLVAREGFQAVRRGRVGRPGQVRAPWVTGQIRHAALLDQRRLPGRLPRRFGSPAAQRRYEAEVGGYEAMTRELLDRIGARGGVELRHPYFDRRLMEFACRIPVTVNTRPGRNRALQRDVVSGLVPDEIAERHTKASFGSLWLREIERHLPDRLADCGAARRGWIDPAVAAADLERTGAVIRARRGGGNALGLWGLVQVEALLRHHHPEAIPGPELP